MPHPTDVEYLSAAHLLRITFNTGQRYDYPTVYLRGYCPCAQCQGHGSGPPQWIPITSWRMAQIEDVTPVGSYALCIVWADGHDTGLYTFSRLLELGPNLDAIPPSERTIQNTP